MNVEIAEEISLLRTFEMIENKMRRSEANYFDRIQEKRSRAFSFHQN